MPGLDVKIILASLDLLEEGEIVFLIERWGSREKDKSDDTDAPEITLFTIWQLLKDFGSYIAWGSTGSACSR